MRLPSYLSLGAKNVFHNFIQSETHRIVLLISPTTAYCSNMWSTYDVQALICSHRLNPLDYVDYKYTYQEEFEFLKSNWS